MRRLVTYIMFFLLLAGTIAAWSWNHTERELLDRQIADARGAAQRLERAIRIQAATGKTPINGRGWPETVDPAWFSDDPPLNSFVPVGRPWVEVASEDEEALTDPPIRQSVTRDLAMFWYNPANGVVRARVGPMISDQRAVDVYNKINGSNVPTLFDVRARLRDTPMLSPAQERLLAGAVAARKPPLIVVRRVERVVETVESASESEVEGENSLAPGNSEAAQNSPAPALPGKQVSTPSAPGAGDGTSTTDTRRADHPQERSED